MITQPLRRRRVATTSITASLDQIGRRLSSRDTGARRSLRAGIALCVAVFVALSAPAAANALPRASFTVSPATPETGQVVDLTSTSTVDTGAIEDYEWYVDGEYEGDNVSVTHVFETPGRHEVSLTVYDENYDEATATAVVSVAEAPTERAATGSVEARLFYGSGEPSFHPIRLQVLRSGQVTYDRIVAKRCGGECPIYPRGAYGDDPSLRVIDFAQDGESEVVFDFGWGNICCRETTVLSFEPSSGRHRPHTHNWGSSVSGPLRDLDGNGRPEWKSSDGRIRYAFGCGGCVPYPVQVVAYRAGRFADVTRDHPRVVRADARKMWRLSRRGGRRADPRGPLAAWAADQYNLGRKAMVWRVVNKALRRGELRPRGALDSWPHGPAYVKALRRWLNRNGYA